MPNWATTRYIIKGSAEHISKLKSVISELADNPRLPNGFGNLWLGNIVDALGGDWNKVYCRGEVIDCYFYDNDPNCAEMFTSTAWGEMDQFRHFLEQALPSLKIIYYCEEPGMAEFYTNDPYNTPLFHIDCMCDETSECSGFYDSEDELFDTIESLTGSLPHSIEEANEICRKFNEEHENDENIEYIYINDVTYSND